MNYWISQQSVKLYYVSVTYPGIHWPFLAELENMNIIFFWEGRRVKGGAGKAAGAGKQEFGFRCNSVDFLTRHPSKKKWRMQLDM